MSGSAESAETTVAGMTLTEMSVSDLVERKAKYNPRKISDHDFRALRRSMQAFGIVEPVVFNKRTGRVVGGHQRIDAAALDDPGGSLPVVLVDIDESRERTLNVALNRISGEWDYSKLLDLVDEMPSDMQGLTGFAAGEIETIAERMERPLSTAGDDPGAGAIPDTPTTRRGDLWILGDHRLLCGDSTSAEDVARAVAGESAELVATDPPYLVGYTGDRPNDSGKDWSAVYCEVGSEDATQFFSRLFENVIGVLAPRGAVYCWHAHKWHGEIARVWEKLGLIDREQVIWVKPTATFGRSMYRYRHEPCMVGWRKGERPEHDGRNDWDTVWEVDWDGKSRHAGAHPTVKPTELFIRPIRKHTRPGGLCFEPFSGSGTQIVAAETTSRRCAAIEISPPFVDVAIERWQRMTGREAVLDETGETFAQRSKSGTDD